MMKCNTKYYFCKTDDDESNLINWVFIGPFASNDSAIKVLTLLKNYNKEIRSAGISSKIINKSEKPYDTTYHVAYNASISKNKQNKALKNGINHNEWIFDFLLKLKPKYSSEDFSTNLPFMPHKLDNVNENKIGKNIIVKDNINSKQKILDEIKNKIEQKKNDSKKKLSTDEIKNKINIKKEDINKKIQEQKEFLEKKKKEQSLLKTQVEYNKEMKEKNILINNENKQKLKEREIKINEINTSTKLEKLDKSKNDFLSIYDIECDEN